MSVLLECLELFFGILIGHSMTSAHVAQRLKKFLTTHTESLIHGQQQVFDAEVIVLQVLLAPLGHLEDVVELTIHAGLVTAVRLGKLGHPLIGLIANH